MIKSAESLLNCDELKTFKTILDILHTKIKKISVKKPQNEFDNLKII
jgi:hypothetical protein